MAISVSPKAMPTPNGAVSPQAPASRDVTGSAPGKQLDTVSGESATAPEAASGKQDPALSSRMAALAQREKQFTQRIAAERRKLDEERKSLKSATTEAEQAKSWRDRLKEDPYGVLQEAGITYDQLTQIAMNQPNSETLAFQRELKQIKAQQEELKQQSVTQAQAQRQAAEQQILADVTQMVNGNEKFEFITTYGQQEAVLDLIRTRFDEDGELLALEDAASLVEQELEDQFTKALSLKKLQAKLKPAEPAPEADALGQALAAQAPAPTQTNPKPPVQTLSNRMSQSEGKPLSAKDRYQRAVLAFQGKLT